MFLLLDTALRRTRVVFPLIVVAIVAICATSEWAAAQPVFEPGSGPFVRQEALPVTGPTAIAGDTALVAADGIVHVFERDPSMETWAEVAQLMASDNAPGFGRAIAFDGKRAIVGAEGAAYVFRPRTRKEPEWREIARLAPDDGNPAFGSSVDIDRLNAIVGAPNLSPQGSPQGGVAYIYSRRGGDGWTEVANFASGQGLYAASVAISGDTAIVRGITQIETGIAHIFARFENGDEGGEDTWGLLKDLGRFNRPSGVAIDDDIAIVGGGEVFCSTSVFGRNIGGENAWELEPSHPPSAQLCVGSPTSISISGDNAIYINGGLGQGRTDILARNQGILTLAPGIPPQAPGGRNAWGRVAQLATPLPGSQRFTHASISGDTALVASSGPNAEHNFTLVMVSDVDYDGIRDDVDQCPRDPQNNVTGGCQRANFAYGIVDDLVSASEVSTSSERRRVTLTQTFTNTSEMPIRNPFFEVTELNGRDVLLNADGGAGAVGATLSPDVGDGILQPGESMTVDFIIRHRSQAGVTLSLILRGELQP